MIGFVLPAMFVICVIVPIAILFLVAVIRMIVTIQVIEQGKCAVIERFGKFKKRADAGLLILLPFVDRARPITWRESEVFMENNRETVRLSETKVTQIDLREQVMDFELQTIITRDNVELMIRPMLVYRLIDPVRVCYECFDLPHASQKLLQTTLRSIIGNMGLDDTLASREEINNVLMKKISHIYLNWGIKLYSAEILEIFPTREIQNAMHKQISSERIRRANIVRADSYREQTKLEAEGHCQSQIAQSTGKMRQRVLQSKAIADARVVIAKAEADGIRIIKEAIQDYHVDPTQYLVGLKYIESFLSMAINAKRRVLYLPADLEVAGALRYLDNPSGNPTDGYIGKEKEEEKEESDILII